MAIPVINTLTASETTLNNAPIVDVGFLLQEANGGDCSVVTPSGFQYAYASASGSWLGATLHTSTPGTTLESYAPPSDGRPTTLRWDISTDIPDVDEAFYVRFQIADPSGVASDWQVTPQFNVDTQAPTVSFTLPTYTNDASVTFTPVLAGSPTHYRISEDSGFGGASWTAISGDFSITWSTLTEEEKSVYVQVRDEFFNISSTASATTNLHRTAPTNVFLRINGSVPDVYEYTGMSIGDDGSFTTNLNVNIDLYAESLLTIDMYITGDLPAQPNVETWIPYSTNEELVLSGLAYNYDNDVNIQVTFRDQAGNTTLISKTIRLNTKVYESTNQLLREPDASYVHQVYEVSGAGATTLIEETRAIQDQFTRRWSEVFYPETHDYPRNPDGTIDEDACIALNNSSNSQYDAVQISGGEVAYDSEGRAVTVDWTTDDTKNYEDRESFYTGGEKYWIIDNTGYGDIDMEFEYFYLNANSYGPPYNPLAPYTGDCLVIYDASAAGATQETIDHLGNRSYTLLDSSKLVELYAYSGEGSQVIDLSTGYSVNATANGAFVAPTVRGISRVCMVLYTDNAENSSGFKMKSGPKHNTVYNNYNVDENGGEVWIHKYPNGAAPTNDIRMIYDYYDTDIALDLDAGTVTFMQDPSGVVSADYSYYMLDADKSASDYTRLYASSNDDFVDYLDVGAYVTPSGQQTNKVANYIHDYPVETSPSGKISSNFTIDKDRGLVEFYNGTSAFGNEYAYVPQGRVTVDYFYHTYKRLANDGFGTFLFRDTTIVADSTPLFPDYTWNDIKIINEGDAILEDGRLKFLPRGYDTNTDGIIDQVLDVNRPWDVQEGTSAETYDKCAMQVAANYTFDSFATKAQCMSILQNWSNSYFGFDVYPRELFYGRIAWVIGGTSGSAYPSTSVGRKTWSAELEGKYYNIDT